MGRTLGFLIGGWLLLDGVAGSIFPQWDVSRWAQRVRLTFPARPIADAADEISRLSGPTLRRLALGQVALAGVMLWLASKSRD